ncbi:hypothetical protein DL546_009485 [Coniochaeta pulveracea]|uniref:thioredoxin-dependent peroxiredoxin n=1 Tax=Coniochaeta pulveracea TaxID=177199 RepID=A0A420YNX2_9PEZI|nr:hypothetical protein DL546_009485 [Coniochaeta pulveracea]
MAPTLRKRKTPPPAPEPVTKRATKAVSKAATKVKEAVIGEEAAPAAKGKAKGTNGSAAVAAPAAVDAEVDDATAEPVDSTANAGPVDAPATSKGSGKPTVGEVVDLESFGGEIETNEGEKTTLKALVDASTSGVVLFTYPKASTPGCTKQVCFFRDAYTSLTAGGLSIYGLSTDSPKANTTFHTKQNLQYPLLCDPNATLIGAIGLKKSPKGTQRGVFVVSKEGKVLLAEPGSPQGTVDAVKKVVEALKEDGKEDEAEKVEKAAAESTD